MTLLCQLSLQTSIAVPDKMFRKYVKQEFNCCIIMIEIPNCPFKINHDQFWNSALTLSSSFFWKQNQWMSRCAPAFGYHLHPVKWSSPRETANIANAWAFVCTQKNMCSPLSRTNTDFLPNLFSSFYLHATLFKTFYSLALLSVFALLGKVKWSTLMEYCSQPCVVH